MVDPIGRAPGLSRRRWRGLSVAAAAWFAVTVNINVGIPIVGALLFPVVFCMLYKCPSPDNLRQVHCKPKVFVAGTRCDARLEAPGGPLGDPGSPTTR